MADESIPQESERGFRGVNEVADAKAARKAKQAFYTPLEVGEAMVREASPVPGMLVLEPHGGDGRLIHLLRMAGAETIHTCETDAAARERLTAAGEAVVVAEDFLTYRPEVSYDRIVMNPPFSRRTYRKHIEHAWSLLAKGGRIVTLGPNSLGQELAVCDLRLPDCVSATWEMVEKNAFKEYGTGIEVTFATLDRALAGVEPEVLGFSNESTAGKVLTIEHDRSLWERAQTVRTVEDLKALIAPALLKTGGSAYGVNWQEVLEHLLTRQAEMAEWETANPAEPPPSRKAQQISLWEAGR